MKNKTVVAGLMGLCIFAGMMMSSRVNGDACAPGIKKEHLDTAPGAFVDNNSIEISTNGVRVKDGGVTAAKMSSDAKKAGYSPQTVNGSTNSVTLPNGLTLKWGTSAVANNPTTISFPTPFGTACLALQVTAVYQNSTLR